MKEAISPVDVNKFKRIISCAYRARIPILAIGHKGIGKSEIVKQFCIENNLGLIDIRLAYLEAQDIVGFPFRNEETGKMSFAPPEWLPSQGNGILFLDELNRARIDVLQAVFQLVRDRVIGGIMVNGENYTLPEGWSIISAMNPDTPDGQYFVTQMDESLYDRFLKIGVVSDLKNFRGYVKKNEDFSRELKNFILEEDIILNEDELPPIEIDATPRGFEMFAKIYSTLREDEEDLLQNIGEGLIGPTNIRKFIIYKTGFYKEISEFLEEIIEPVEIKSRVLSKIQDRNDIIIAIRDRFIIEYLNNTEKFDVLKNSSGLKNFMSFVFSLSEELIVAYLAGIKDGFGTDRQGKYLTEILPVIYENDSFREKYLKIAENNKEIKIDEYI
jgi:hypothetical protein